VQFRKSLDLLGQVLAHFEQLVTVDRAKLDVCATLADPHSALAPGEVLGKEGQELTSVHRGFSR
jgi:hypothetical protein